MPNKIAPSVLVLILFVGFASLASADLDVGVKRGDWIEYNVTYTGAPTQGHDVTWARMEILDVEGTDISVSITSRFSDGSTAVTNSTLNLQTGHLIDDFIIPANLEVGSTFLDENYGNMTISSKQTADYAGAPRTVLSASAGNNTYVWDQATGVSVEGTSQTEEYSIHTVASATNMWEAAPQGLSWTMVVLVAAVVLIVVVVVALALRYRRKRAFAKQ
ncbi:MAG: hypothetical protein ACQCN6_12155 [Candidatus Bathyarchaeia archaeon]|jgi:hypothetical protein